MPRGQPESVVAWPVTESEARLVTMRAPASRCHQTARLELDFV